MLVAGVGFAVIVRAAVAGSAGSVSMPAAATFAGAVLAMSWACGWRPALIRWGPVAIGLAGGLVLLAGPAIGGRFGSGPAALAPAGHLAVWALVVTAVAVGEEVLLRGVLWDAVSARRGPGAAMAVSSVVFALMHIPMYGWRAAPLDLAAGLWLGGLRWLTRGTTAPAVAHVLADLAGAWL